MRQSWPVFDVAKSLRCNAQVRELKLPRVNAALCSHACFKDAWSSHNAVHAEAKQQALRALSPEDQVTQALARGWMYCLRKGQTRTGQLPFHDYTGPLQPYPISPRHLVSEKFFDQIGPPMEGQKLS